MPFESMLLSAAVVSMFVGFADVLIGVIFKRGRRGRSYLCVLKIPVGFQGLGTARVIKEMGIANE
jgi:hypothetical protein